MEKMDCPVCGVGFWRTDEGFAEFMSRVEKTVVTETLRQCGGSAPKAAEAVGLPTHSFRHLMAKHGLIVRTSLDDMEKEMMINVLTQVSGSPSKAAIHLNKTLDSVKYLMKKYKLKVRDFQK